MGHASAWLSSELLGTCEDALVSVVLGVNWEMVRCWRICRTQDKVIMEVNLTKGSTIRTQKEQNKCCKDLRAPSMTGEPVSASPAPALARQYSVFLQQDSIKDV